MKVRISRKLLSALLVVAMLVSALPMSVVPVYALGVIEEEEIGEESGGEVAEEALALQSGEAVLYPILANGTAEVIENITVEIDDESAAMIVTSDSFSPFDLARHNAVRYYGREALSALTNSTALLYAYDQLVAGVESSAEIITVYNGTDAITQIEIEMVMDAYRRDYAHHFWLGNSYQISGNATSVVRIKPTYTMSGMELETAKTAFEQKLTDILSGITSSMSEYEKELYLHDKLAETVTYEEGANAHSAYGALVDGRAVCEGYAEALQCLLQRVGIQSFLAVGTSINPVTNTAENHEWNYVKIDGEYYHVDLTWDDQGEDLFHAYFNQTDTVIQEEHTISTAGYALPVCNSTIASYFTGKDEYLDVYTVETVGQLLKEHHLKVHVYIPGTVNDFLSWYQIHIADIGMQAEVTGGFSYGYAQLGREWILYVLPCEDSNVTVSGTVTSFGGDAKDITIELYAEGSASANYTVTVQGNTAAYSIEGVVAGTYTMKIMKNNHVTREYPLVVGTDDMIQDAKIHLIGDADCNGRVNIKDLNAVKAHNNETAILTGYEKMCADTDGNGKINIRDWNALKAHLNETAPLW